MPRYFFNVEDGTYMPDQEGVELPDLETARSQAIATVGAILREGSDSAWAGRPWRMVVADEKAKILLTLDFAARQFVLDETSTAGDLRRETNRLSEEAARYAADVKSLVAAMWTQIEQSRELLDRSEVQPPRPN